MNQCAQAYKNYIDHQVVYKILGIVLLLQLDL